MLDWQIPEDIINILNINAINLFNSFSTVKHYQYVALYLCIYVICMLCMLSNIACHMLHVVVRGSLTSSEGKIVSPCHFSAHSALQHFYFWYYLIMRYIIYEHLFKREGKLLNVDVIAILLIYGHAKHKKNLSLYSNAWTVLCKSCYMILKIMHCRHNQN